MSKLSRLIGMASKALGDKAAPGSGAGAGGANGGDWRSIVRGAADALTGDSRAAAQPAAQRGPMGLTPPSAGTLTDADRKAIARYDYLVQTADPAQLEQIHRDAFARLSAAQRAEVEARLSGSLPPHERPASSEPSVLARAATRAEMLKPGSLRGLFARVRGGSGGAGGRPAGAGMLAGAGVAAAGGLLAAVAGGAIVSAVAAPMLEQAAGLVDFDAIASGIDPESLVSGIDAEAIAGGFGEQVSGLGDQASGFGDQLSNFELPDLGDLFGR
ncbi:cation-transporting ATPase [Microbacterium oleivorans]|uniref:Cation-transporting ATPase n=1 Tax=Microbacterium oleivorans TaxID=273677 RepID=A0A7D5F7P2_9MICO|nr:cation-transporting ATPase [Microbacterium oleivorans]QLD12253.1 cation-transporting ATPase [Microbacterium oleivorans]